MPSPERQLRRRQGRDPYARIDTLLRTLTPHAMERFDMPTVAQTVRGLARADTEHAAFMGVQALAAIAVTHATLAYRALEMLDDDQRAELLANAPDIDEVMAALEGRR